MEHMIVKGRHCCMKSISRKLLIITMICTFILSMLPTLVLANSEGAWEYTIVDENNVTLTRYNGTDAAVTVPEKLGDIPVTCIENGAFDQCKSMTSVVIPDSVTKIIGGAFWECTGLSSITFSGTNPEPTYISEDGIVYNRSKTELVQYPAGKSGSTYSIPATVEKICNSAFDHNRNLASITIPDSVTRLEEASFWRCRALTTLNIPKNVAFIAESAFANGESLQSITVSAGNGHYESIGGVLFEKNAHRIKQYPAGRSETSYTVPSSVTSIAGGAFRGCNNLKTVSIPASVKDIGGCAFAYCESLETITIHEGITDIFFGVFQGCGSLTSITLPKSVTHIDDMAFQECSNLEIYGHGGSYAQTFAQSHGIPFIDMDAHVVPSAYLSKIKLSAGAALKTAFKPGTYSYTVLVQEDTPGVIVTPVKAYDGAKMTIDRAVKAEKYVQLTNGQKKTMTIKVTMGKQSKTYKLTIKRLESTNNALIKLATSAGKLSPDFDPKKQANPYRVELGEHTGKTTITASAAEPKLAKVYYAKKTYSLKNGQTKNVTIRVRAQSGANRYYHIVIHRAESKNANLIWLRTNNRQCKIIHTTGTEYTMTLPAKTSSVTIRCSSAGYHAKVTMNGENKTSKKITLLHGESTDVHIVVTAQAGNTKEYIIHINRL